MRHCSCWLYCSYALGVVSRSLKIVLASLFAFLAALNYFNCVKRLKGEREGELIASSDRNDVSIFVLFQLNHHFDVPISYGL